MITSPHLDQLASHHQYQGKTNHCGPYCAAMIINSLKQKNIDGEVLGNSMEKIRWKNIFPVILKIKNWATFPWGIKAVLKEDEISSRWMVFQNLKKLERMISRGNILIVIIGKLFPVWAHYKILVAVDPNQGYGFIDPAFQGHELHWETAEYFKKRWNYLGNQVICVSTPVNTTTEQIGM